MKQDNVYTENTVRTTFGIKPNGVNSEGIKGLGPNDGKWPEISVTADLNLAKLLEGVDLRELPEGITKRAVADVIIEFQGLLRKDFEATAAEAGLDKAGLENFKKKYELMKTEFEGKTQTFVAEKEKQRAISADKVKVKAFEEIKQIAAAVHAEFGMVPELMTDLLMAGTVEKAREIHVAITNKYKDTKKKN